MSSFFVDSDISLAKTIHTDVYTDDSVFKKSREAIFSKSLHYVGDADMLIENGYVYPQMLLPGFLDEPILMVKDKVGGINCLSNVCTHRGNLLVNSPGKMNQLRCGYHGRTFDLQGEMLFMPEFQEVRNFPCAEDHLSQIKTFQWGKLIFVALNNDFIFEKYLGEMMERMSFFPIEKLVRRDDLSKEYNVDAHWALYCENYLEGFHIPFVHQSLAAVLDFGNYDTEIFYPYANLQIGIAKDNEYVFDLPSESVDFGRKIAAYYFWVFPNMMFNFYPWGLSLNIVKPISKDRTQVSFVTYMLDESLYNRGAGSELDRVEMEDEAIVMNVQKGVRSRFYNQGRYSVAREKCTHHFHTLLAQFL